MVKYCGVFNCKNEKLPSSKVGVLFCLSLFLHVKMIKKTMKDRKEHRHVLIFVTLLVSHPKKRNLPLFLILVYLQGDPFKMSHPTKFDE